MNKIVPTLITGLVCIASASQAQVTTQTRTFGPNIPQFSSVLTFDKYHGPVSEITAIEITWEMAIEGGLLVIDNDAVDPASGTYEFGALISVDGDNTTARLLNTNLQSILTGEIVFNAGTFSLTGNVDDGRHDFDESTPDGMKVMGESASSSDSDFVSSLVFGDYVDGEGGTPGGTFDIAFDTQQHLTVYSNGGTEYAITPVEAQGSVTIKYFYEVVPEPTTPLLLGLAAIPALLRRRRS